MNIDDEILINQYGQNLVLVDLLVQRFSEINLTEKKLFLREVIYNFIQQSKAINGDISKAIELSCLRPTYTPCIMIKKGINTDNLEQMVGLPENELEKVFILFLSIFKIAYQRRFELERNNPKKWWYWDLSDKNNIVRIKEEYKSE